MESCSHSYARVQNSNAQTDFKSENAFYLEKNQIKVPSISRVKIDQFQEQAIDSVLNMQKIWLDVHSTIT